MALDISALFISLESTLEQAITSIDSSGYGVALVVDERGHLLATVIDSDVRRAMLANIDLKTPMAVFLANKAPSAAGLIQATIHMDQATLDGLSKLHSVRHVPILDDVGRVVDVYLSEVHRAPLPVQAVVMAGGFGKRLRPLTDELPKPMLPVGGRPLMELIIEQLHDTGIQHVYVTTHYMPEKIKRHFGDGRAFGVNIQYIAEDKPLGTAGGISLIETPDVPLLVINGDILTRVNFRDMLAYHQECKAELTLAVRKQGFDIPFGVVETDNGLVTRITEKPTYVYTVNAGIYLVSPGAHRLIPKDRRFDMTDLIALLLARGENVASFMIREYWLDIGHYDDYQRAQQDIENGPLAKVTP